MKLFGVKLTVKREPRPLPQAVVMERIEEIINSLDERVREVEKAQNTIRMKVYREEKKNGDPEPQPQTLRRLGPGDIVDLGR